MARIRMQIIGESSGLLPRDSIVNTVHFSVGEGFPFPGADYGDLANDLATQMATKGSYYAGITTFRVKAYELGDDKPRYPRAEVVKAVTGPLTLSSPREVALCLSFRGARNTPRERGRIYVGPIAGSATKPSVAVQNGVLAIADIFSNLGGTNVDWCVYSRTEDGAGTGAAGFHPVKYAWVDNEWDTVRRRGLKADSRVSKVFDE